MFGRYALTACICAFLQPTAASAEPLPGPIPAELVSVIDGDTVAVRARIWPGQFVETRVRLASVDTPERRGADCARERALAEAATVFTEDWLSREADFALHEVETGSFAGRVIARIVRADGGSLGEALTEAGLAVAYGAPAPWCSTEMARLPSPR
jgi:micrococcal nuclease